MLSSREGKEEEGMAAHTAKQHAEYSALVKESPGELAAVGIELDDACEGDIKAMISQAHSNHQAKMELLQVKVDDELTATHINSDAKYAAERAAENAAEVAERAADKSAEAAERAADSVRIDAIFARIAEKLAADRAAEHAAATVAEDAERAAERARNDAKLARIAEEHDAMLAKIAQGRAAIASELYDLREWIVARASNFR